MCTVKYSSPDLPSVAVDWSTSLASFDDDPSISHSAFSYIASLIE